MLQGDGINIHTLQKILDAVLDKGYSAEVRPTSYFWRPIKAEGGLACSLWSSTLHRESAAAYERHQLLHATPAAR